ncbi:MAG: hypothetical protein ACKO14_09565 [Armatimonadota bacterium]
MNPNRRQLIVQSGLVLLSSAGVIEGCGGGGGTSSGSGNGTRDLVEGLSITADRLSSAAYTKTEPGSLLAYPSGRQVDDDPFLIGAFVGYSVSISHQLLFDTYKRSVHQFYLARESLKCFKITVNAKETVMDNSAWVAGTMRKQLLSIIGLSKVLEQLLSAGIADEAKAILAMTASSRKELAYCSFMLLFNAHVNYMFEVVGKPVNTAALLPDAPSLDSVQIDALMQSISNRISLIPYGIPWAEGRDVSKSAGSSRGIDGPEWVVSKTLDYMSQSHASYVKRDSPWNKDKVTYDDYLARKNATSAEKLLGNGAWVDKSKKAKELAKDLGNELFKELLSDTVSDFLDKKAPMFARKIEQVDAAKDVLEASTDMFKYAALAATGGPLALIAGGAGLTLAALSLRDSLFELSDSLIDEYFLNDPVVKSKLDEFNRQFQAKKRQELLDMMANFDKIMASMQKNGQPVPVKQLPVVTNPNTAETDVVADSGLTPSSSEEYGPWPLSSRVTRGVSVIPSCFADAIIQLKLDFEATIKSCSNLGYKKTAAGFTYFRADFAALIRRDPSMRVAEFPAITSAQMICTAPGYVPMTSDGPKNINDILQLPELKPLSAVSLGININVK